MGWKDPWAPPSADDGDATDDSATDEVRREPISLPPMAPVPALPPKGRSAIGVRLLVGALVAGLLILLVIAVAQLRSGGLFGRDDDGSGANSRHLAVRVSTSDGLRAGETVTVRSTAFRPNRVVGVAVCLAEADTAKRGVDACDTTSGARFSTDADGRLEATFAVPQAITVAGGAYDCGATADPCLLVAADAGDFDQSGGVPITFRSPLREPPVPRSERAQTDRLPITATIPGPYRARQQVALQASGFQPNEPVLLAWCTSAFEVDGPFTACQGQAIDDALTAIADHDVSKVSVRADAKGVVRVDLPALPTVAPLTGPNGAARPFDCTTGADRCRFVVAAAADTKRSAVLPYSIAG